EDIVSIISFLRTQEPVKHVVKPTEYKFLGKALLALGVLKPEGPKNSPPKSVVKDTTKEYGMYMAKYVANCVGCHTERDMKTGEFIGKPFAGGLRFEPDAFSQGYSFITPNLTPDKETGILASWDENTFVKRLHSGRVHNGSPMPWGAFSRINDTELKAIYAFLMSLDPVSNKIDKVVFAPGEKMPE
ncbi:MAG: c-type cytochrome, partial [Bacteroidia bacterium]